MRYSEALRRTIKERGELVRWLCDQLIYWHERARTAEAALAAKAGPHG